GRPRGDLVPLPDRDRSPALWRNVRNTAPRAQHDRYRHSRRLHGPVDAGPGARRLARRPRRQAWPGVRCGRSRAHSAAAATPHRRDHRGGPPFRSSGPHAAGTSSARWSLAPFRPEYTAKGGAMDKSRPAQAGSGGHDTFRPTVGQLERLGALTAAAALVAYGASRRSPQGAAVALAAAPLAFRGLSGHWPGSSRGDTRRALGGPRGSHVREAVRVERPVDVVYGFWRQVENLPRFM